METIVDTVLGIITVVTSKLLILKEQTMTCHSFNMKSMNQLTSASFIWDTHCMYTSYSNKFHRLTCFKFFTTSKHQGETNSNGTRRKLCTLIRLHHIPTTMQFRKANHMLRHFSLESFYLEKVDSIPKEINSCLSHHLLQVKCRHKPSTLTTKAKYLWRYA